MPPREDLTGRRFGCVVVQSMAPHPKDPVQGNATIFWVCLCDCGATETINVGALRAMGTRRRTCPSCRGSARLDRSHHPSFVDMTDKRVGTLKVVKRLPNDKRGNAMWRCVCDCGEQLDVQGIALRVKNRHHCTACRARIVQRVS